MNNELFTEYSAQTFNFSTRVHVDTYWDVPHLDVDTTAGHRDNDGHNDHTDYYED